MLTPLAAGTAMAALGAWGRRREEKTIRLDRFGYGFAFALSMALVRFLGARHGWQTQAWSSDVPSRGDLLALRSGGQVKTTSCAMEIQRIRGLSSGFPEGDVEVRPR